MGARKNFFFFATNLRASWMMRESVFRGKWLPCSSIVPKGNIIVLVCLRYFLNSFIVMFSNMIMVSLQFLTMYFYLVILAHELNPRLCDFSSSVIKIEH